MNKGYEFFGAFVVVAILLSVFAYQVKADTLITYEDGSTYTLQEDELIYISPEGTNLYRMQTHTYTHNGNVIFVKQSPSAKRDYVEPEVTEESESNFSQWCADFDTSVGYTFGYMTWQRQCDTNNDGEYNICDYYEPTGQATFEEIQYNKVCLSSDGS